MNKYTTKNVIERGKTTLEQLADKVNLITWGLLIIVGGLLFTLGGIINTSWAKKQSTYQSLVDKVNEQSVKMDYLIEEIKNQKEDNKTIKINKLEQQIKDIKTENPYLK